MDDTVIKEKFKRFQEEVNIYNQIGKALTSSLDSREILQKIMHTIADYFRPSNWSLLLLDESTNELYFEIVVGKVSSRIKNMRIKLGEGLPAGSAFMDSLFWCRMSIKIHAFRKR